MIIFVFVQLMDTSEYLNFKFFKKTNIMYPLIIKYPALKLIKYIRGSKVKIKINVCKLLIVKTFSR
jgi:hypothetical protein